MADLNPQINPQPLPPSPVSLEDAVAAITRGVLRALDARAGQPDTADAAQAEFLGTTLKLPGRIIAGGILEPFLEKVNGDIID